MERQIGQRKIKADICEVANKLKYLLNHVSVDDFAKINRNDWYNISINDLKLHRADNIKI